MGFNLQHSLLKWAKDAMTLTLPTKDMTPNSNMNMIVKWNDDDNDDLASSHIYSKRLIEHVFSPRENEWTLGWSAERNKSFEEFLYNNISLTH